MKKIIFIVMALIGFSGCMSNESKVKDVLRKNPKFVFDVIEENPEQFLEVVNRAATSARQKEYENRANAAKSAREQDLKNPKQPKLSKDRRLLGDDAAKIVVVEYADFQCPACRMAYQSLTAFKKKYKGQVQFYFKNMPLSFHKAAMPAAVYLEAMRLQGNDKAFKFYEFLFQHQSELGSEAILLKGAKEVGADLKRLAKDIQSEAIKSAIAEDMKEFEAFGFTGTPVVIVNGVAMTGAPGLEDLERIVQDTKAR